MTINWREDMPVSMEVFAILGVVANAGAYLLSGESWWIPLIPIGLVAAILLPMSAMNVIVRKSIRATVFSVMVPVLTVGPALFITFMFHRPGT